MAGRRRPRSICSSRFPSTASSPATWRTLIKEFNESTPPSRRPPVYTGSYDETLIKTRAAIKAGKPPAAVIMSANFLLDLKIEGEITKLDDLIKADGTTNDKFMGQFFPALHGNAVIDRTVYGVPFHNSTPLLYFNADHFKEAGLDPDKPPQTWAELAAAAKKLTKREGDRVTRWGITIPSHYDYRRLDPGGADHVERRPLLQRGLRRRGLLRHALDARRADLLERPRRTSTRSIRPGAQQGPAASPPPSSPARPR